MRVAALYDIHGNLPALEAVLAAVDRTGVDRLVVGGDSIWGPFPSETVEVLRALGDRAVVIAGNSEREVVDRLDVTGPLPPHLVAPVRWTAERLADDQLEWIAGLAKTSVLDVDELGPTLFCHATPRSDEELVTAVTPDDAFARVLDGVRERVVCCGHTHMRYERRCGLVRVVNPGSVGLPYEPVPGAYWALLGPDVRLQRTTYDVPAAVAAIRASGFPSERFAEMLASPPAPSDMIERFEAKRRQTTDAGGA